VLLFRSILPAAMALLAAPGAAYALVFESDGLPADERVEFAGWSPTGPTYRAWRAIEARAARTASVVVTRTEAAKSILAERGGPATLLDKIFVIPNSRDPAVFGAGSDALRADVRAEWGISRAAPCVLYAGSIGPQYHLDEMVSFFGRVSALRPDARLVLLTTAGEAARSALARAGVPDGRAIVRSVPPSEVARHIAAADLGLALRTPTFSQRAVSPVKVAEYLLCGVPALSTPVGDLSKQLEASAGLLISEPCPAELDRGAAWFAGPVLLHREAFRAQCREVGLRHFALEDAVRRYAAALHRATLHRG
jgi:glycosyltransferase involved in cell wall biosynthesis